MFLCVKFLETGNRKQETRKNKQEKRDKKNKQRVIQIQKNEKININTITCL